MFTNKDYLRKRGGVSFKRLLGGGFASSREKVAHAREAIGVVTFCDGLRSLQVGYAQIHRQPLLEKCVDKAEVDEPDVVPAAHARQTFGAGDLAETIESLRIAVKGEQADGPLPQQTGPRAWLHERLRFRKLGQALSRPAKFSDKTLRNVDLEIRLHGNETLGQLVGLQRGVLPTEKTENRGPRARIHCCLVGIARTLEELGSQTFRGIPVTRSEQAVELAPVLVHRCPPGRIIRRESHGWLVFHGRRLTDPA